MRLATSLSLVSLAAAAPVVFDKRNPAPVPAPVPVPAALLHTPQSNYPKRTRRPPSTLSSQPTDKQVLQYALAVEHMESAFYAKSLPIFTVEAFVNAGYPSWVRGRIEQIGEREAEHVTFLQKALGADSIEACSYDFPVKDPQSFVALSELLEGVGASAYLGATHFLHDRQLLSASGDMPPTDSRRTSWLAGQTAKLPRSGSQIPLKSNNRRPWYPANSSPLTPRQVFSLATPFITSCPASNPMLPMKPFPKLVVHGKPIAGRKTTFSFDAVEASHTQASERAMGSDRPTKIFLALFSGLDIVFVDIILSSSPDGSKTYLETVMPEDMQGLVYAVVTTNDAAVTDDNTLAGPAVISFESAKGADWEL